MGSVSEAELADAAQLSSLADETPEGRSIVVLAKQKYDLRGREVAEHEAKFIPFTAQTRMSGVDMDGRRIRKGATESVIEFVEEHGGRVPPELREITDRISRSGGTPLVVADRGTRMGVIHLKDVVKGGMRERFEQLRAIGIRTVMITGDNPLTAAAIAAEAGVDDFLAQATPKDKMDLIKKEQAGGRLVAMTGDGTNDAPALAQADVGAGDEHRHHGGQGSRQHGGPRQQSDQAHRNRGDRQAAADDARRADDVLDRQRRRQVLRDPAGDVHGDVSGVGQAEHHGSAESAERDSGGRDLQRADHHRADSAGAARREVPRLAGGGACCGETC